LPRFQTAKIADLDAIASEITAFRWLAAARATANLTGYLIAQVTSQISWARRAAFMHLEGSHGQPKGRAGY